ncbi:hypothetical protein BKA65DRAFT_59209 [Rhexocercosporidium sp. MPI-PUGE-AT-0058]|nr:hypothetical protein BKA65DRAFT_59209 [Rhexocercosporidium sp. MPI-PUGE-AT-0058]
MSLPMYSPRDHSTSPPHYVQTPHPSSEPQSETLIAPSAQLASGIPLLLQAIAFHASTRNGPTHLSWSAFGRFCISCVLLDILRDPTCNVLARDLISDWRALREDIDPSREKSEPNTNASVSLWREVLTYVFARHDARDEPEERAILKANLRASLLIIVSACLVFTWAYIWIPWDIELLIISSLLPLHHFLNRNLSPGFTQPLVFTILGLAVLSEKGGDEDSLPFIIARTILTILQLSFMVAQAWSVTMSVWNLGRARVRRNERVNR